MYRMWNMYNKRKETYIYRKADDRWQQMADMRFARFGK